jgi:hypothetical protein
MISLICVIYNDLVENKIAQHTAVKEFQMVKRQFEKWETAVSCESFRLVLDQN